EVEEGEKRKVKYYTTCIFLILAVEEGEKHFLDSGSGRR
ncbi:hypothetical protein Tco_0785373, partial [Tanacetum coccineum]